MTRGADPRLLVVHLIFRFDAGGLENGVVNLIKHLSADAYRQAVVSLTDISNSHRRVERQCVTFTAPRKPPVHGFWIYPHLFCLFRKLQPAIVHGRNLVALEMAIAAWVIGVPICIHGEHGRHVGDLDGSRKKFQWVRRFYAPFVTTYVALSRDLASYLMARFGVAPSKVAQIYNGVDAVRFHPAEVRKPINGCPFTHPEHCLIGTVGRMRLVKEQTTLALAFVRAIARHPDLKKRLRLVMIGDGMLPDSVRQILEHAGLQDLAWLPGQCDDVPEIMRGLDCFVLPSLAEGVSNTILEAMASGLPVIATDVGGNRELVEADRTGTLVPSADVEAMARQIVDYAVDRRKACAAGRVGGLAVECRFSMAAMTRNYQYLYDQLLSSALYGKKIHGKQPNTQTHPNAREEV